MQIIAMLSMLIDHIGLVFYPEQAGWRLIGRLAFPLYAYCIVIGYRHTSNVKRYLIRLIILAAVSQIPFMWGLHTEDINVIATFVVCLTVLIGLDRYSDWSIRLIIVFGAGLLLDILPFDYGSYGLILVLIYRYTNGIRTVTLHAAMDLMYFFAAYEFIIQFASLVSTIAIVYGRRLLTTGGKIKVPRWVWRAFYPAHLTGLALLYYVVK